MTNFESKALRDLSESLNGLTLVPHSTVPLKILYPALRELLNGVRNGDVESDLRAWDDLLDRIGKVL